MNQVNYSNLQKIKLSLCLNIHVVKKITVLLFIYFSLFPILFSQNSDLEKLVASDGVTWDRFGASVSSFENFLVIGSPGNSANGNNAEAVYVYEKLVNGEWGNEQKIIASDGQANDIFGASVSIYADYLVVGAKQDDDNGSQSGSVYVYEKDAMGVWGNEQKIIASDGQAYDSYGWSVCIIEDQLFVGSVNDAEDGTDAGALYVYEKDINGIWSNEQKLKPSDGSQENYFGYQIEVFENTLVVSACGDVNNDPESGSVYVYEKGSNGTWGAEQKLTSFDAFKGDWYGKSIDVFENYLVVGAMKDDDNGENTGIVFIYKKDDNGVWNFIQKIGASDAESYDKYGWSVAVFDQHIAVGAYSNEFGPESGSVYVYELDSNGVWGNEQKIIPPSGLTSMWFSEALEFTENYLVIGASRDNANVSNSGSVYILDFNSFTNAKELTLNKTQLFQNYPNPFKNETSISFYLEHPTEGKLTIMDSSGKIVKSINSVFLLGKNEVLIDDFAEAGIYFYTLEIKNFSVTKKMIVIE